MQTWKLIGAGLLISVLVRGCPHTTKQSTSLAETQPLQSPTIQREFGLSSKPDLSLPKIPTVSPISPLLPVDIQEASANPVFENLPADSEEKVQPPASQILVVPPVDREAESRSIQQEPETNPNVPRVQASVPIVRVDRQSLVNQGSDQRTKINFLELPNSLNPVLRSDTTTPPDEENVAPQSQPLFSPVYSSSSGTCNYTWEFDSASNRCGERAASERPNLSAGSAVRSHSAPIRSYSIPTSSYGSTHVRGYFRRDGTYVRSHFRRSR
jgi:hypothetical protein